MATRLRHLNEAGIDEFRDYLIRLREQPGAPPPWYLLNDDRFSAIIRPEIELEEREECTFDTRYELGVYLRDKLAGMGRQKALREPGLWSWLALFFFDQLCPADKNGQRKPREIYSYILSRNFRHYPRHAVRTTYQFVSEYGGDVRFMFSKPLWQRGEIVEQLAARIELASAPSVIKAASLLYSDPATGSFKRGSAGRKGGSIKRYIDVLKQYQLTYDLYTLEPQALVAMLPKEFGRFRGSPAASP